MRLHQKLARLRRETGQSQETVAEKIGVSRQAAAKWESGESLPDLENLIALSRHFLVSIDSLLKDEEACHPALPPPQFDHKVLEFLCRAKKATYAGKGGETESSRTASHDLIHREGDLVYYDTYLGSERFSGEEALWKADVPIWALNYTGRVLADTFSGDFLKEALAQVPLELPFRGPLLYQRGGFSYHSSVEGTFEWFRGTEEFSTARRGCTNACSTAGWLGNCQNEAGVHRRLQGIPPRRRAAA